MPFVRHRENSRRDWGAAVPGDKNPDTDAIKLGCLLRIADAAELMAKNYGELIAERDRYERDRYAGQLADHDAEAGRAAHHGEVTPAN
jgi:hypothetical protein